jgi:hypothetical protein
MLEAITFSTNSAWVATNTCRQWQRRLHSAALQLLMVTRMCLSHHDGTPHPHTAGRPQDAQARPCLDANWKNTHRLGAWQHPWHDWKCGNDEIKGSTAGRLEEPYCLGIKPTTRELHGHTPPAGLGDTISNATRFAAE